MRDNNNFWSSAEVIIIAKHACYRYFGTDKNNEINSRDRNEEKF